MSNDCFSSSYNSRKKIYNEYLREISGVNFTQREIDIMVCILHSRGDKKIASFLFISPRTVSTHIRNIMLKLGCSSRENLIDFIEKSGKLQLAQEYYLHLLIFAVFEQQLQKIGKTINRMGIAYTIDYGEISNEVASLFQQLEEHLKLANVITIGDNDNTVKVKYNLCILSEKVLSSTRPDQIFLKVYDITPLLEINDIQYIDFSKEEDYYSSTFTLLRKIINKNELETIIQEFNNQFQAIKNTGYNNSPIKSEVARDNAVLLLVNKNTTRIFFKESGLFIAIFLIIIVVISSIFKFTNSQNPNLDTKNLQSRAQSTQITQQNMEELAKFVNDLSADNVTKDALYKNHNFVQQVEHLALSLNNTSEQPLNYRSISSEYLMNYLYVLHALASYYTHHEHDGEKARKMLQYAKNLAENYVTSRSKLPINFDKLKKKEIYAELAITKHLPELYTRIIYLLGRTYIYQGDKMQGVKYFELSRYLGNKLNIFEGHLSSRNGLGVIKEHEMNVALKNKDYKLAIEKANEAIQLYEELKYQDTAYNIGYKPGNIQSTFIIPKDDIYNQLECSEQIAKYYGLLALIVDKPELKAEYIKEIEKQFIGTRKSPGLLLLLQTNEILGKKAASLYNTLGNFLLKAYDKHLDIKQLKNQIVKALNLNQENDLEVIQKIFKIAQSKSRNTEFTKADSYDGLVKVYKRQINSDKMKKEDKDKLLLKINELEHKRDEINKELKREYRF